MAARLNRPGDFQSVKGKGVPVQLLPPSSFKQSVAQSPATQPLTIGAPSKPDPWEALTDATKQITLLKLENAKLREVKPPITIATGEDIKARVDVHHSASLPSHVAAPHRPLYDVTHYDDIINRQAAELSTLKKQLQTQETESQRDAVTMETKHMRQVAHLEQDMASIRKELSDTRASYGKEVEVKSQELHRLQSEMEQQESHWSTQLAEVTEAKARQEAEMLGTIHELEDRLAEAEHEKTQGLQTKDSMIEQQTQKINLLKSYISESEETSKSTDIWRKDVENLKNKLQKHEKENENLKSTIHLLNIRLSSQNKILTVQENELAKDVEDFTGKNKYNLLTRWREKVYALMVQQKSLELSQKDEERRWRSEQEDTTRVLRECQSQLEVFQHTLHDKDAQLEMERHTVKQLQEELTQAQELAMSLDAKNQEDRDTAQMLADFAHNVYGKYQEVESFLVAVTGTIKNYGQRIAFASGRVEMLQSQFARREALLKLKFEGAERDTMPKESERPPHQEDLIDSTSLERVAMELERVTHERDRLASQLKEDALLLEENVKAAKAKYADEVEELKQRILGLHEEIENKKQKIDQLTSSLERHETETENMQEKMNRLREQLGCQAEEIEKVVNKQKASMEEEFGEKISAMDSQLNSARREQAKAVVSLRQIERQSAREKERMAEYAHTVEQHYTAQCAKLEERIRSLEKERNLLMATIRQEGLLGKVKSQRHAPVLLESEEESSEKSVEDTRPRVLNLTQELMPESKPEEPLHAVIDDLRSLTAAVLDDHIEDQEEAGGSDVQVEAEVISQEGGDSGDSQG